MNYKEKKRSMFFGLPWTFTSYTVTEEIITVDTGLFKIIRPHPRTQPLMLAM